MSSTVPELQCLPYGSALLIRYGREKGLVFISSLAKQEVSQEPWMEERMCVLLNYCRVEVPHLLCPWSCMSATILAIELWSSRTPLRM